MELRNVFWEMEHGNREAEPSYRVNKTIKKWCFNLVALGIWLTEHKISQFKTNNGNKVASNSITKQWKHI